MNESKPNRRVRYTKMVLRQSLLDLMETQPINKITVTDICTKADINRGTFYAYYSDPYDLLVQIEQGLYDIIKESIGKTLVLKPIVTTRGIFDLIAQNGDLCRILFSEFGDKEFLKRIIMINHNGWIEGWRASIKSATDSELEWLYTFTINGSIGIIQKWIQDGMRESTAEISELVEKFSNYGLHSLIK
jgi:AcrR family transcriptional regulator